MIPAVGSTCSFVFTTPFTLLNGVYRVLSQTPFLECVKTGVDFVENLYTPAGLDSAQYVADYNGYTNAVVSVLQSVTNESVLLYAPNTIFGKVPDPTIREFFPLVLAVDLGVQKNTQEVIPLIDAITDLIRASLGTTNPVKLMTNSDNKVYLTDAQYQLLVAAREANKEILSPLSVQLKTEQDKNTVLAAKVAAYEEYIRQMGTPVP